MRTFTVLYQYKAHLRFNQSDQTKVQINQFQELQMCLTLVLNCTLLYLTRTAAYVA